MHQTAPEMVNRLDRPDGPSTGLRAAANRRYYVCLGVLLVAAVGLQASALALKAYFRKEALPTKKPFYLFDSSHLGLRYALAPQQPPPMPHDLIENLGTENYIQMTLIDRDKRPGDSTYLVQVFLSYYTGKPDMVPHNPKECMQAGGWALKSESDIQVDMTGPGVKPLSIPVSVLQFEPPQTSKSSLSLAPTTALHTVMFFFYTNGGYATTRSQVRWKVANLADRYAYYSKIEVSFSDDKGRPAPRDQAVAALDPLLQALMPVLWKDHYQDWDAVKNGAPPVLASP